MRVFSLNTVALVLVVLSLAVPTGAVFGDHVGGNDGIVLSPHNGPNGKYASYDSDGNLTIDLGDDLNADSVTAYDGVFDVTNNASHASEVWITHDATDHVEFRTAASGSIQGEENSTVLSPGETVVVGLTVDTRGASPGTQLIQEMSVHAREVSSAPTRTSTAGSSTQSGSSGSTSGSSGGSSGGSSAPTATPEGPSGTTVASARVTVELDGELRPGEEVDIDRLDELPSGPAGADVRAIAIRADGGTGAADAIPASDDRLRELGVDTAVTPGETMVVSGTRSILPSVTSLNSSRRIAAIYDIAPPRRLAHSGGTIWVTVDRSRLNGADPSDVRLARRTDDGWHLLETQPTMVNDTHVQVKSRTPGFSVFVLVPRTEVDFRWTFEGRETVTGERVPVSFDEPGVYEGTLAVTDALGRSDRTSYRVLVNDRPRVRIDRPATIEPGEPVTLRANVTDEFGGERANVTWQFEDGTVAEGTTVTRTFDRGEHVVTVVATDEYGAVGRSEETLVGGSRGPVVQVVEFTLGVEGRIALVALLSLLAIGALRWLYGRRPVRARRGAR